MVALFRSQDLWAGILFVVAGTAAVVLGGDYSMGSSLRMGPGYFPRALGYLLIGIGVAVALSGIRRSAARIDSARPGLAVILVPAAVALFAALLEPIGLPGALIVLTVLGAGACRELRPLEIACMAIGLAVSFTVVFIALLGLPFQIWPWFLR